MGARRTEYQIVARYMEGIKVVGYHLQSIEKGNSGKFTREQVAYLIGRGQITNAEAQIYQDELKIKGINGTEINKLKTIDIKTGQLGRLEEGTKIRRGLSSEDVVNQFSISRRMYMASNPKKFIGYEIRNSGGGAKKCLYKTILDLASQKKIANARTQMYNGRVILRGDGILLNKLDVILVDNSGVTIKELTSEEYETMSANLPNNTSQRTEQGNVNKDTEINSIKVIEDLYRPLSDKEKELLAKFKHASMNIFNAVEKDKNPKLKVDAFEIFTDGDFCEFRIVMCSQSNESNYASVLYKLGRKIDSVSLIYNDLKSGNVKEDAQKYNYSKEGLVKAIIRADRLIRVVNKM